MSVNSLLSEKMLLPLLRFLQIVKEAMPGAIKTSKWLLKLTIPVSLGVFLLNIWGILAVISVFLTPFFKVFGLPTDSALILLTSIFTNIYSVVAVLSTLSLPVRDGIILATMALISHGFIVETAILKKTGSSAVRMLILRLVTSLLAGILLNLILPNFAGRTGNMAINDSMEFLPAFILWLKETFYMTVKIIVLISALMILQKALEAYGILPWFSKLLSPFLRVMGLPKSTSLSWIIANAIGLAYGSVVIMEQVEHKKITKKDADLLNHHIAISHSQLEDPLLFLTVNLPVFWLIWPRIVLAIIAVWLRRLELGLRKQA